MSYAARGPFVDGWRDTAPGWGWAAMILPQLEQPALFASINSGLAVEAPQNATVAQSLFAAYLCPSDPTPGAATAIDDGSGAVKGLAAPTSYAASVGGDETDSTTGVNNTGRGTGLMFRNSAVRLADVLDGSSQTIAVGERARSISAGVWPGVITGGVIRRGPDNRCPTTGAAFYPAATLVQAHGNVLNTDTDPDGGLDDFSARHPGGANCLFADGSVHFLKSVLRNQGTRPDGSTIYSPESLRLQALCTRAGREVVAIDAP